jgi:hypothetical protein
VRRKVFQVFTGFKPTAITQPSAMLQLNQSFKYELKDWNDGIDFIKLDQRYRPSISSYRPAVNPGKELFYPPSFDSRRTCE